MWHDKCAWHEAFWHVSETCLNYSTIFSLNKNHIPPFSKCMQGSALYMHYNRVLLIILGFILIFLVQLLMQMGTSHHEKGKAESCVCKEQRLSYPCKWSLQDCAKSPEKGQNNHTSATILCRNKLQKPRCKNMAATHSYSNEKPKSHQA